ncbi:hypothetical protein [Streptomyces sp. NPDC093109]|uniref:hypothetical protein n=1 Tax=Streptomyces sp. NPDC093109 TaxID=3154977 RepID=UPI0034505CD4
MPKFTLEYQGSKVDPLKFSPMARNGHRSPKHTWQGISHEFGEMKLVHSSDSAEEGGPAAEVRGESVPNVFFEGFSLGDRPRLTLARLRVGGEVVETRRRSWALRKKGRALRLAFEGNEYRCTAVNRKSYTFTRSGVRILVTEKGRGESKYIMVNVDGPAGPADISLGVVFAGANRAHLTWGGAVRAGLTTFLAFAAD